MKAISIRNIHPNRVSLYIRYSGGKLIPVGVGGPNGEINESKVPPMLQWGGIVGGFTRGKLPHKPGWYQHDHQGSGRPWILDINH